MLRDYGVWFRGMYLEVPIQVTSAKVMGSGMKPHGSFSVGPCLSGTAAVYSTWLMGAIKRLHLRPQMRLVDMPVSSFSWDVWSSHPMRF